MTLHYACQAFATIAQLKADTECSCSILEDSDDLLQEIVDAATDLLFLLSDGRVHGRCTRTARPMKMGTCGPLDGDLYGTWPATRFGGADVIPIPGLHPTIDSVKIDGVTLNAAEYKMVDGEFLLRVDGSWPTSNSLTLASSDVGVFEITWTYGPTVDWITQQAAIEMACELLESTTSGASRLPKGTTSANIQGAAVEIREELEGGREASAGMERVRRFFAAYCRDGEARSGVWTPELTHGWQLVQVS